MENKGVIFSSAGVFDSFTIEILGDHSEYIETIKTLLDAVANLGDDFATQSSRYCYKDIIYVGLS